MSVDHVIMLTVAPDGKPYLVEISVLSVSKKDNLSYFMPFFCCFGCMVILTICPFVTAYH